MKNAELGLIGLGVMGQNLALNFDDHKIAVNVYDKNKLQVDSFISSSSKNTQIIFSYSLEKLVSKISKPRKIMLMIKAGEPVDIVLKTLVPLLDEGDVIIDGGNSHFDDTIRRVKILKKKGLLFLGMGVSGGEEGARFGPAIMPGGNAKAWPIVKDIYQSISAKVDDIPCCQWIGEGGAGHYVKMVHNGIEYGDMQLIAEAYQFMHEGMGIKNSVASEPSFKTNLAESTYLLSSHIP
jgi:6-phosphogluconate dehydrogenase